MIELVIISAVAASILLFPKGASAHCDTPDGPVVVDGKKALEAGEVNYALKWIDPEAEAELKHTFELCSKVRVLNEDARKVADHHFLETLVRLHRAGGRATRTRKCCLRRRIEWHAHSQNRPIAQRRQVRLA